jgi:predicted metal-binding protein
MSGHDHPTTPHVGVPDPRIPEEAGAGHDRPADAAALAALAVRLGADGATHLAAHDIVVAEWVLMKCRYGCPDCGRRRTCPPFTPSPDQFRAVLQGYRSSLLIWVEAAGRDDLPTTRRRLHQAIVDLERAAFLDGNHKAFGLVDGTCVWCAADQECVPSACRHPEKVRPSLGACGVDAFATAAAAGVPLQVVRERGDAYRLLGMLLID